MSSRSSTCLLAALPCIALPGHAVSSAAPAAVERSGHVSVHWIDYRGWHDSILLSNGLVEAVIVPEAGRIMQFRLAGAADGPFWENPEFAGRQLKPDSNGWANYGGDKAWPAPQVDWTRIAGHIWPPPEGFDGLPAKAVVEGDVVTLISPVDRGFGIGVRRRVELVPDQPVMKITTVFEKSAGPAGELGVWVITQLKDPDEIRILLPSDSRSKAAIRLSEELPPDLRQVDGQLALTRDPEKKHKIGAPASSLVWIGRTEILRIDSALVKGGKYPDQGSSAEVYTNPDPLTYVELEMLGPLIELEAGHSIERVSTYTLSPRREGEPAPQTDSIQPPHS